MASIPIYSWSNWSLPGVTPMHWVNFNNNPAEEAKRYVEACKKGDLPLMFKGAEVLFNLSSLNIQDFFDDNFGHEKLAAWVSAFFGVVAYSDKKPPMLVIEYEAGISNWVQPKQQFIDQVKKLPKELKDINADKLHDSPWNPDDFIRYNRWCMEQKYRVMRKAIVTPATAAFGQPAKRGYDMPIVNYGDMRMSYSYPDINGWEISGDMSLAGWSSPSCYLADSGNRYAGRDPYQGRLEDSIEYCKSCRGTSPRVAPWISWPSHGGLPGEKLWPKLVQGVAPYSAALLFWNALDRPPEELEKNKKIAQEVFETI